MTPTNMNRRRALQLGAAGATAMMTIRPALAQTVGSVLKCKIQVPEPAQAGKYIAADGTLVAPGTAGAVAGSPVPFTGQQVKAALAGGALPGTTTAQNTAYLCYIQRLQFGQAGYTCYASLQMPH
ncbi:MAG: hypothetical protein RL367_1477 [Pseudomonadota bacterium]|jgi:hypothetical protein